MAFTEASSDGVTNNTTAVTVVAAPGASTRRLVKTITVVNTDTVSATVYLYLVNGANSRLIMQRTLTPGQPLITRHISVLDATNKSVTIKLGGTITTNQLDWTSHFADVT